MKLKTNLLKLIVIAVLLISALNVFAQQDVVVQDNSDPADPSTGRTINVNVEDERLFLYSKKPWFGISFNFGFAVAMGDMDAIEFESVDKKTKFTYDFGLMFQYNITYKFGILFQVNLGYISSKFEYNYNGGYDVIEVIDASFYASFCLAPVINILDRLRFYTGFLYSIRLTKELVDTITLPVSSNKYDIVANKNIYGIRAGITYCIPLGTSSLTAYGIEFDYYISKAFSSEMERNVKFFTIKLTMSYMF